MRLKKIQHQFTKYVALLTPKNGYQMEDNDIHRINLYTMDNPTGFPNTCPLDSDLCDGQRYSTFKQPGPELKQQMQNS